MPLPWGETFQPHNLGPVEHPWEMGSNWSAWRFTFTWKEDLFIFFLSCPHILQSCSCSKRGYDFPRMSCRCSVGALTMAPFVEAGSPARASGLLISPSPFLLQLPFLIPYPICPVSSLYLDASLFFLIPSSILSSFFTVRDRPLEVGLEQTFPNLFLCHLFLLFQVVILRYWN